MLRISFFLSLLLLSFLSISQENIALGTWRFHPSIARGVSVATSDEKVYVATENGILVVEPTSNTVEMLTIENTLSSLEPTQIAVNEDGVLVIGYADGNIDLIEDNLLTNIPDFKNFTNNSSIIDSKAINHISFKGADTVFFSTASGVLAYNLSTNLVLYEMIFFQGTPLVETQASAYHTQQDSLYIIADSALYRVKNPDTLLFDITDLDNWDTTFIHTLTNISSLAILDTTVYVGTADAGVYYIKNNTFVPLPSVDRGNVKNLIVNGDTLYAVFDNYIIKSLSPENSAFDTIQTSLFDAITSIATLDGIEWISTYSSLPMISNNTGAYAYFSPLTLPSHDNYGKIDFVDNQIVVSPDTITKDVEFSSFIEGLWYNENPLVSDIPDSLGKITKVIEVNSTYYFGTEGTGLYSSASLTGGTYEQLSFDDLTATATINDMFTDAYGNLWILQNSNSLCKIEPSGESSCPYFLNDVSKKMLIDNTGDFWFISNNNRLSVYNEDFTSFNLNISNIVVDDVNGTSIINDMALDLDGELWLASPDGIGFYPNPSVLVDTALRPILEGFPILNNFNVEKIIVDGANRKWLVTQNDVSYLKLLRPDGKEVLEEFNEENSPLITNEIKDIKMNKTSGELFVATSQGLYSYRSDASEPSSTHQNVKVFPNPVPPNFGGTIAISGLVRDASIKITDISGNLVHETTSNGGTATWSGKDYTGSKAKTGVYLIFSSSEDGQETFVAKIAVIE